jgi:hypothetical protein
VRRLSACTYEFCAAIAAGRTVGAAIARASANAADFDLAESFEALIGTGIVVALELSEPPSDIHI